MTLTIAQVKTLYRKWRMYDAVQRQDRPFETFLDGVSLVYGCDGAVTVQWAGMWLCIERDGHCHT